MNFLAPLFLAGALAVGLPLAFHLIRRTTRERTLFSSLMFLKPTPPRLTRRSRLEHILLLLLRCAAICLLATGFARPFVKQALPESPSATPPKHVVILVDDSASMRRANLWSQARDRVAAVLRNTTAPDRVALFTFDRQLTPLVTFEEWSSMAAPDRNALASSRLAQAKPGWAATRLDQAIVRASELLSDANTNGSGGPRQIVVVSDFQSGSTLNTLQGQEWPKGVKVISEPVIARTSNAGLQILANANDAMPASDGVRLRVSNAADSRREQFQVGWARNNGGLIDKGSEIYVPAGQSRVLTLARPEANAGADRIILLGDDEDFDDSVFTLTPRVERVPVLYFGADSATNSHAPLYFVQRAFQATPQQQVEVVAKDPAASVDPKDADAAAMFIVSDTISEPMAILLRDQMQQGKTLLFAPTSAEAAGTLGLLLGQERLPIQETVPRNYAMLGEIDFRHPLFAPFADARYSDFTKVHFWKYRRLDTSLIPNSRLVAKFDNGDAAIVEFPVGRGRIIFFASGWGPGDSQLALSTKFVPLLYSALEWSGAAPAAVTPFHVGDAVPLAADRVSASVPATITLPNGSSMNLAAGETNFTETTMPGIYLVKRGTSARQFAVNLDPAESRTAPLPLDELERLGVPANRTSAGPHSTAKAKQLVKDAELEDRQKLWRWFIIATLAVLFIETGIAGWTARKLPAKTEAAL